MNTTFENAATKSADVNGTNFVFPRSWEEGRRSRGVASPSDCSVGGLGSEGRGWLGGKAPRDCVRQSWGRRIRPDLPPKTVEEMAQDAVAFIGALGFSKVDLFGFSLGGFRRSGHRATATWSGAPKSFSRETGPCGGRGPSRMSVPFYRTRLARQEPPTSIPKHFLFFTQTSNGQGGGQRLPAPPKGNARRTSTRRYATKPFRLSLRRSRPSGQG